MSNQLVFNKLETVVKGVIGDPKSGRAKVPGGWIYLVISPQGGSLCFIPDPDHKWDGASLP